MIIVHLITSLLSYVAFLIAFVAGLLFLVQERQLKHKTMGLLFHRLPALDTLDRINFLAIGIGFGLLTFGTLFGFLGAVKVFGSWWMGDPKEYLTVFLWGSYLALWLMRLRSTLRGRRVALLSVLGFSLVLFTWMGTSWFWHSFHPSVMRLSRLAHPAGAR